LAFERPVSVGVEATGRAGGSVIPGYVFWSVVAMVSYSLVFLFARLAMRAGDLSPFTNRWIDSGRANVGSECRPGRAAVVGGRPDRVAEVVDRDVLGVDRQRDRLRSVVDYDANLRIRGIRACTCIRVHIRVRDPLVGRFSAGSVAEMRVAVLFRHQSFTTLRRSDGRSVETIAARSR